MKTKQLNKEYDTVMYQADKAIGRKEAISLFRKAESIRKKIYAKEEYPLYKQVDS